MGNGSGDYSALVLDQNGRPRVAYRDLSSYSLAYLWCDGLCESLNNPHFAYDAEYMMECLKNLNNPNDPSTYVETKW